MYNWKWVWPRAYSRAAFALVVAFVSMVVVSGWQSHPVLSGLVEVGRWLPLVALAATLALAVAPTYRLLRWERGNGPCCPGCHGPLGHERAGHANRGGAYRQCYACGVNVNHVRYR